jgi:predicted DNA binding CopG/RHH family protein
MAKAKTAEEFDRRFDQGEDIFDLADIKPEDIKRPGLVYQRINIDVPAPMLERLDNQAAIRGITRQSLITAGQRGSESHASGASSSGACCE